MPWAGYEGCFAVYTGGRVRGAVDEGGQGILCVSNLRPVWMQCFLPKGFFVP